MDIRINCLEPLGNERFRAELSDGREIRVSSGIIAEFSLFSGMELSQDARSELEAASRLLCCKERALKIINTRLISQRELYDKLVQKGGDAEAAEECVKWLLEMDYLDDAEYAVRIVRHYAAKGYGAQRIKNELYRRKVDRAHWDDALEEMPDMDDTVYRQLCSKLKSDDPDRDEIKRAADALARRGHSWDQIKGAINRYKEERGD